MLLAHMLPDIFHQRSCSHLSIIIRREVTIAVCMYTVMILRTQFKFRIASSPLPSRKDTFHHDYDTSVDKSPIPKSLQKTATSSGQGANYAWKAYAPGAYSSQFSPARGITKTSEYSSYPMDGVHQENAAPEAALALSDLDDYSYINKSTRSESPLVQRNESPLRNSTINGRSPIALSSPIYSFGRTVQPMNASQSSRLTFPVKPRQSAFSKIPFSRMSSPEGTEAKEDTKSLSVQSRQGTPVAEALVIESVTSPLERDVEALKTKHEELKKDVYGLKEREGAHQQVSIEKPGIHFSQSIFIFRNLDSFANGYICLR